MLNVSFHRNRVLRRTTLSAIIAGIIAPSITWVPSFAHAQVIEGSGASANATSTSVGDGSSSNVASGTAVGTAATVTGDGGTALGASTHVGAGGTAVGYGSMAGTGIAIGENAMTGGGIAIGENASSQGADSVSLGNNSVDNSRANVVSIGGIGAERQLINLAPGTAGTDGVNVNQLKQVIAGLGGGASLLTGPSYLISTTSGTASFTNVGDALSNLGNRVTTLEGAADGSDIADEVNVQIGYQSNAWGSQSVSVGTQAAAGDSSVAVGGSSNALNQSVAIGNQSSGGNNGVAIGQQASAGPGNVSVGMLTSTTGTNSVSIGYASSDYGRSNAVSFGTPGNERTLINVAPGQIGTDAANMNQLSSVASTLGGSFDSNGTYVPPTYALSSGTYSTVSAVFANLDTRLTTLESSASTGGTGGVTEAYVQQQVAAAVQSAATYTDTQSTQAVTTANAYTDSKVASITTGTGTGTGSGSSDTATLASANGYTDQKSAETLATANGYTDQQTTAAVATSKSYTDEVASTTLNSAKSYTDQQVGALSNSMNQQFSAVNSRVDDLSKRVDGIGAMGAAASSNMYNPDSAHDFQMGIGIANFRGAVGYSVGAFRRFGSNTVVNLKVSGATQSAGVAVAAGVNIGF